VILIPFLLCEKTSDLEVEKLLNAAASRAAIAIVIVVLALVVFLPVPSSVVSTASHALLAFWIGTIVSTFIVGYRMFPIGLMMKVH
jgi:uncharacterized membrane protein YdjX (TVP38/TMEM64 family)